LSFPTEEDRIPQVKTWFATVTFALLMPLSGVVACADRSEEEIRAEFREFVESRDDCEEDDDCTLVSAECPFGCYQAVNARYADDVRRKAEELVDELRSGGSACAYGCAQASGTECRNMTCAPLRALEDEEPPN
jgi:hypothetical protein